LNPCVDILAILLAAVPSFFSKTFKADIAAEIPSIMVIPLCPGLFGQNIRFYHTHSFYIGSFIKNFSLHGLTPCIMEPNETSKGYRQPYLCTMMIAMELVVMDQGC
jgi:hypothetical protein